MSNRLGEPTVDLKGADVEKGSTDWLESLAADLTGAEARKCELEQLIQQQKEDIENLLCREVEDNDIIDESLIALDESLIALEAAEREIRHIKELQGYVNRMDFLAFPAEIQQMIFNFLLAETKPIALSADKRFAWQKSLAVFRVCKAMGCPAQETFYKLNSFDVLQHFSDNACIMKERRYSPLPKYLQHLRIRVNLRTIIFDLFKGIEGCENLNTLTLVFSYPPDFRGWRESSPPKFELPTNLKKIKLAGPKSSHRTEIIRLNKLFTKIEKALGTNWKVGRRAHKRILSRCDVVHGHCS